MYTVIEVEVDFLWFEVENDISLNADRINYNLIDKNWVSLISNNFNLNNLLLRHVP